MAKITITEALQEVKTINARIVKKQESVANYLARDSRILDPLAKSGGAEKFIREERQSIGDLRSRLISIRSSIQQTNLNSPLTVAGYNRSVSDWLTWRREVSSGEQSFINTMLNGIRRMRDEAQKKGGKVSGSAVAVVDSFAASDPPNIIINVDEMELMKEQERIETCLGELDGKLSLFNATTFIEV